MDIAAIQDPRSWPCGDPDAVQAVEIHHDLAALRIDVYVRGAMLGVLISTA